jgi:hypothetical protein
MEVFLDKWELIGITLDQLIKQWETDRDSFEADATNPGIDEKQISWSPKITAGDNTHSTDPMGLSKAVILTYNKHLNELSCGIYKVNPSATTKLEREMYISTGKWFMSFRKTYKKFLWLREQIRQRDKNRKSDAYLKELYKVFPRTFDQEILGKEDD